MLSPENRELLERVRGEPIGDREIMGVIIGFGILNALLNAARSESKGIPEGFRDAVYAWIREDCGLGIKLQLTRKETDALLDRLTAMIAASPSVPDTPLGER